MGSLVEGLDDHIADELGRIREELRVGIVDSGYTIEQLAALAGVGPATVYAILSGRHTTGGGLDTLLRVAFVLGVRIELATGEKPSFRVVPLAQTATGNRRSSQAESRGSASKRAGAGVRNAASVEAKEPRTVADQRRKRPRQKPVTLSYLHLAA